MLVPPPTRSLRTLHPYGYHPGFPFYIPASQVSLTCDNSISLPPVCLHVTELFGRSQGRDRSRRLRKCTSGASCRGADPQLVTPASSPPPCHRPASGDPTVFLSSQDTCRTSRNANFGAVAVNVVSDSPPAAAVRPTVISVVSGGLLAFQAFLVSSSARVRQAMVRLHQVAAQKRGAGLKHGYQNMPNSGTGASPERPAAGSAAAPTVLTDTAARSVSREAPSGTVVYETVSRHTYGNVMAAPVVTAAQATYSTVNKGGNHDYCKNPTSASPPPQVLTTPRFPFEPTPHQRASSRTLLRNPSVLPWSTVPVSCGVLFGNCSRVFVRPPYTHARTHCDPSPPISATTHIYAKYRAGADNLDPKNMPPEFQPPEHRAAAAARAVTSTLFWDQFARISQLYTHPTCAVWHAPLGVHTFWMLIGACDPDVVSPIKKSRLQAQPGACKCILDLGLILTICHPALGSTLHWPCGALPTAQFIGC